MTLQKERQNLYAQIPTFWADLAGEPYALYDCYVLEKEEVTVIQEVTERIGHIYFKTAQLLRTLPDDTLLGLGYPKETISILRHKPLTPESVIARIDLVKTQTGYKHFEINADTPTFIMECFLVNGLVASHFGYDDPNQHMEGRLQHVMKCAIEESSETLSLNRTPYVVFTSHEEHEEDRETVRYLVNKCPLPCRYVPLHKLQIIPNDGLYDESGRKIDILYRQTYPLEHMMNDQATDGTQIGVALLALVTEKKLAIINPPSSFLLQNKAVQAVIWGLHEESSPFFTLDEHRWIDAHFLPTYLEAEPLIEQKSGYVKKPSFGREGDTIELYDPTNTKIGENEHKTYTSSLPIYQQLVSMPTHVIQTPTGKQESHLLLGSFLLGGQAGAIGCRAGNQITGNESCFLPIGTN